MPQYIDFIVVKYAGPYGDYDVLLADECVRRFISLDTTHFSNTERGLQVRL